uniref:Myelin associated oligodendrocyte basic protein n=3 Tax=Sus scrofa TaxID=9823 RepID=A0A8D1CZA2_PIG
MIPRKAHNRDLFNRSVRMKIQRLLTPLTSLAAPVAPSSLVPLLGAGSEMSQKVAKEGPRLSKNQKFSEHFSIHCCPPFTFLNSKREIVDRKYSICKSGCFYQKKEEDWICCACQKTRLKRKSKPTPRKK